MNPRDGRFGFGDRRLYETRPWTWIVGIVAGALLSLGLLVAGDRYVRVAKGATTETVVVKPEGGGRFSVVGRLP